MYDCNGNKMTAEKLNDDGVVYLLCTIFGLYDGWERYDSKQDRVNGDRPLEVTERLFGGQCEVGNSHN